MQDLYMTAMVQIPLMIRECKTTKCRTPCRTPGDMAAVCADMQDMSQESMQVVILDSLNNIITRQMITLGLLDASLIHPREVFRAAIQHNGAALMMVHNHPSGDTSPSAEDLRVTKQMVEAGRILGIPVLDHVIIGRPDQNNPKGFLSMRESGMIIFAV